MSDSAVVSRPAIAARSIAAAASVAATVVLPQIVHYAGVVTGLGASLGESLLPMQLPVLAVGLLVGPEAGVAAGVLGPVLSFAITGMPPAAVLPFLVVELAVYGLAAGALSRVRMPLLGKLLVTQTAGRVARLAAALVAVYALGSQPMLLPQTWGAIVAGIPGVLLQWGLVPLVALLVRGRSGERD